MGKLQRDAAEFLAQRRIAVAGVARDGASAANIIYRRMRRDGFEVVPVNPNTDEVEGDRCYRCIADIPNGVDGVVIATAPDVAPAVVDECISTHTPRVWLHRSFGRGSMNNDAVKKCREAGIEVIAGACPMMFMQPVDFGHRCMRGILSVAGKLPE